jgi:hypothetical protein
MRIQAPLTLAVLTAGKTRGPSRCDLSPFLPLYPVSLAIPSERENRLRPRAIECSVFRSVKFARFISHGNLSFWGIGK